VLAEMVAAVVVVVKCASSMTAFGLGLRTPESTLHSQFKTTQGSHPDLNESSMNFLFLVDSHRRY